MAQMALKKFVAGERIKATETNGNNEYLENKINSINTDLLSKMANISTNLTPFSINKCNYINGNQDFLYVNNSGEEKTLRANAPFIYTTGNCKSIEVDNTLYLDISDLEADVTYNIFVDYDEDLQQSKLVCKNNTIYKSVSMPVTIKTGDIWVNTLEPFECYLMTLTGLEKTHLTLAGTITNDKITAVPPNSFSFTSVNTQFNPFSINNGTVKDGKNNTVCCPDSVDVTYEYKWTQPKLTSNGTIGGDAFACWANDSAGNAYKLLDGNTGTYYETNGISGLQWGFYNPVPIKVSSIVWTPRNSPYHNLGGGTLRASNDGQNWDILKTGALQSGNITNLSDNTKFYKYYQFYNFSTNSAYGWEQFECTINATYQSTQSEGVTLVCDPCTITTADGRTKKFTSQIGYDIPTGLLDGTYKVLKSIVDGSISLAKTLVINAKPYDSVYNYTPVGTITNDNGKISGFSSTSWAETGYTFNLGDKDWEMYFPFKTGTIGTAQHIVNTSSVSNQAFDIFISEGGCLRAESFVDNTTTSLFKLSGTTVLSANTEYVAKLSYDPTDGYKLELSTDNGETWTTEATSTVATAITQGQKVTLGADFAANGAYNNYAFTGSIDLNNSYIKVGNKIVWEGVTKYQDHWLDISQAPLSFKKYQNGNWVEDNDNVYIANVTITDGKIAAVNNLYFNREYRREYLYGNSQSGYKIDLATGYCEQWGYVKQVGANVAQTVQLLKKMKNTSYNIQLTNVATSSTTNSGTRHKTIYLSEKQTQSSFDIFANATYWVGTYWRVSGFLADGEY